MVHRYKKMIKLIFAVAIEITTVGFTNNDQVFLCAIILSHFLFAGVEWSARFSFYNSVNVYTSTRSKELC